MGNACLVHANLPDASSLLSFSSWTISFYVGHKTLYVTQPNNRASGTAAEAMAEFDRVRSLFKALERHLLDDTETEVEYAVTHGERGIADAPAELSLHQLLQQLLMVSGPQLQAAWSACSRTSGGFFTFDVYVV